MFDEAGWVNKIITAGIIAMIGWTLLTVQSVSVDLAVLAAQVESLDDRLQSAPSVVEIITIQQRVERQNDWLERLDERLDEIEDATR